ncbi:MAG: CueP family metal-binding protein [Alkalispirochaeta sp.]
MRINTRRISIILALLLTAILVPVVLIWNTRPASETAQFGTSLREELRSATAQEALDIANRLRKDEPSIHTTLTAEHVEFVFPDGRNVGVPVDTSEMIVSVAPYRLRTHPCAIHSISGCQGDITDRPFEVAVYDRDGELVVNRTITTGDNGFFEIALPRDSEFLVSVESNLGRAERLVGTHADDPTCITDMQLL